jgi:hypothetical protein
MKTVAIPDMDTLAAMFDRQFPDVPTGGFLNPTFVSEHRGHVEFRCFYDNYDNEDDSWTWYWDSKTGEFYN